MARCKTIRRLLVYCALSISGSRTWAQTTVYDIVDLGALSTTQTSSSAHDINNSNQVVGLNTHVQDGETAFIWDPINGISALQELPGHTQGGAYSINDIGQVAGNSRTQSGIFSATRWESSGSVQSLGGLVGGGDRKLGYGINNLGQVVGQDAPANGGAFFWDPVSGMTDLGDIPGGRMISTAEAINDLGQVVGMGDGPNGSRAFRWSPATGMEDLGVLPGFLRSQARDINQGGQIVGRSWITGQSQACLWDSSSNITGLGDLPDGDDWSLAYGLNNVGQIVGVSDTGRPNFTAFLWAEQTGMINLNHWLAPSSLGWELVAARAINDHGFIVGNGIDPSGQNRAYLATPIAVPEPHAITALALGLYLVVRRKASSKRDDC